MNQIVVVAHPGQRLAVAGQDPVVVADAAVTAVLQAVALVLKAFQQTRTGGGLTFKVMGE